MFNIVSFKVFFLRLTSTTLRGGVELCFGGKVVHNVLIFFLRFSCVCVLRHTDIIVLCVLLRAEDGQ